MSNPIIDKLRECFDQVGISIEQHIDEDAMAEADRLCTAEVEGFRSERDFTRALCRQVIGMRQDLAAGNGEQLLQRILWCEEGAQHYLLLYGHGITGSDILGNGLDNKKS